MAIDKYYHIQYYFPMRITIKGQVTVPQAMRERFKLHPGTEVEFIAESGGLRLRPCRRGGRPASAFETWIVKAAGSARTKRTTDQILAATRGED